MGALEDQVRREQETHDAEQNGAARSVEDIDPEEVEEPTPPMMVPLEGFAENISVSPGGDKPKTSSLSLRGGKLPVTGEFKKGDVIEFYVRARVAEVQFVDTVDKFGEVTGTERKHVAKPIGVRRLASTDE